MSIEKVTETELRELGVAALPAAPSAPSLYAGNPLGAKELREAFDRLPRKIAEKFNALVDSLGLPEGESETLASRIATGISAGHSLEQLFRDLEDGSFSAYLKTEDGDTLEEKLAELADLAGDVADLQTAQASLGGDVAALQTAQGALAGDVSALQTAQAALGGDVAALQAALADLPSGGSGDGEGGTSGGDADALETLQTELEEVRRLADGFHHALVFEDYEDLLTTLARSNGDYNTREKAEAALRVGDNIFIRDTSVPDLWVSGFSDEPSWYPGGFGITDPYGTSTYEMLAGHVQLSRLETGKMNLGALSVLESVTHTTLPTAAGQYVLKCTVAGGTPSFTWASAN